MSRGTDGDNEDEDSEEGGGREKGETKEGEGGEEDESGSEHGGGGQFSRRKMHSNAWRYEQEGEELVLGEGW